MFIIILVFIFYFNYYSYELDILFSIINNNILIIKYNLGFTLNNNLNKKIHFG
jgi:hypothetical protein